MQGEQVWRHASCLQLPWLLSISPIWCIPHHLCSLNACCPMLDIAVLTAVTIMICCETQSQPTQTASDEQLSTSNRCEKRGGLLACMCGWGLVM